MGDPHATADSLVQQAVDLARRLLVRARELQTSAERRQQAELDRMISAPADKATLVEITDQAFRSHLAPRAADQLIHILDVQGVPRFFSALDRTLLRGFQTFGGYLPGVAMPLVQEKMQHETANVVLPAEEELLRGHLEGRRREGLRMNVNFLGEALLGEADAERRLQGYLAALQRPEIEVVSVKISTIYSQISALAREHTVAVLCDRLELLFRAAAKGRFTRADGTVAPKFVYLDMEEYRDKEITSAAFMRTLDRPGLEQARAGIALQAYIPDSFATQRAITDWARRRAAAGRAPVTIRLVKGANMEMERVEASLRGWPLAPFHEKADTDANYHRMLEFGMQSENLAAVHLGVASHNLFTLAYGLVLAARSGRPEAVQFEMLEGMANHQRRALVEEAQNVLLYAPACRQEDFTSAIGYLIRRLDENTGPDNFLRHAFRLEPDSDQWQRLERGFVESFARIDLLPNSPRRTQDRSQESGVRGQASAAREAQPRQLRAAWRFSNEADTDWSLPANGAWAQRLVDDGRAGAYSTPIDVPLAVAGEEIMPGREVRTSTDPSRPGARVAHFRLATLDDVNRAVACARQDPAGWRRRSPRDRAEVLARVADELARERASLMLAMLAEGGKVLSESDPEVSEAIDFCRFYGESAEKLHELDDIAAVAKRVVVVVSPWNFPLAIPCGGVAAALAAGNTVLLKPASDTVLIAFRMCECFWRAGVPREALQFMPASSADAAPALVGHPQVDAVILTGGTATAQAMLDRAPGMHLLAETGGKNATIVTALADRDMAIKNVLHSAFSHSGQKCSATSLLILEEEVYHDAGFRAALCDAVESLAVGSAWDLQTKIGPLIRPPSGELERGLKELEPGESWAVMPRLHVDGNPRLVSPGVKWGVAPGGFTHCTELFGPVLGVMSARNLREAIHLVNATGYGLTSGLESLDDREHELWREGVRAGNLYINRPTTGAVVLRQPFGGMGKSAFGPGVKAGGPNYVVPLMRFEERVQGSGFGVQSREPSSRKPPQLRAGASPPPALSDARHEQLEVLREAKTQAWLGAGDYRRLAAAIDSYLEWADCEFLGWHDHFRLLGEDNFRRYLPVAGMRIRVHGDDSPFEVFARAAAARAVGCRVVVSSPPGLSGAAAETVRRLDEVTDSWAGAIEFLEESNDHLAATLVSEGPAVHAAPVERLRYADASRVPLAIRRAAAANLVYIADAPVLTHGRIELVWYVREQSISHAYHRYGNLGRRGGERRASLPRELSLNPINPLD